MRRGISPVIAVLLLIVIAVAAAVLTYIWVVGYMGSLQQQSGTQQLQERIKIEAVQYNGTAVIAYVRNIGEVNVNVTAIYVINSTGTVLSADTNEALFLTPGNAGTVDAPATLSPGATYTIKVVTEKGTEATYTFTYRT